MNPDRHWVLPPADYHDPESSGERVSTWVYIRRRMSREFDLATLTFFGVISALVIGLFAFYRFWTGSVVGGVVDIGIAVGLFAVVYYAWRGSNVPRAGAIFVWFAVLACIASSVVFGRTAAYWTFLLLCISFVIAGRRAALIANLFLVAALAVQVDLFPNLPEHLVFVVTGFLVTMFGYVFNSRYNEQRRQMAKLANQDPLTGAGTRRVMREKLLAAVASKRKADAPAVAAVLDLDHFKAVNDTHGHEAGDQVLITMADVIRERLRRDDGFFRLGGEEFVVVLPQTQLSRAGVVFEEIHQRFNATMSETDTPVTVSIGAAEVRANESWSDWLRRADAALYQAKRGGRNRVILAEQGEQPTAPVDRRQP